MRNESKLAPRGPGRRLVKCELCADWFKLITYAHLKYVHGWRGRRLPTRYKRRFRLPVVASDETRDKIRRRVRTRWLALDQRRTRARVLGAMRDWVSQGRRLASRSMPGWLWHAGVRHFGTWKAAVEAAVGDYRQHSRWKYRTREHVVEAIRDLAARGADLTPSVVKREHQALYKAATRMFPWSWRKALRAARVDPAEYPHARRRWNDVTAAAYVRQAAQQGPVHARAVPVSLYLFVRHRLGRSWPDWVGAVAGSQAMADHRPVWSRARVIRAVRRLLQAGIRDARSAKAADGLVAAQARRTFGSWKRAVQAAREP